MSKLSPDFWNGYKSLKKYQLSQFIQEFKPETKSKILNSPKNKLIDYIKDNFSDDEIQDISFFQKYGSPYKTVQFEKKLNLPKLKKDENIEIDQFDYTPYSEGKKPIYFNSEKVILQEHQNKFIQGFLIGNLRSAIAFHGVGTGKTLTAVACSRLYLQLYPQNKVIIITPSAVLFNFIESMALFGVDPRDKRYSYFTYDKFANSKVKADDSLLIVDEAHNFRSPIEITTFKDKSGQTITQYGNSNKRGQKILERGGIPADKVLLLTATPFVNRIYDIENLLSIGAGREPISQDIFGDIASNNDMRYDYFKYTISHYEKSSNSIYFPERREKFIPFEVPESDNEIRAIVSRDKNNFYIDSRQAGLKYDNAKFSYIINTIKESDGKKFVVYTSFQDSGVKPLEALFKKENITFGLITGKQSTTEKSDYISSYNDNKIQVLIITRAGAEGVNLKETRGIFIIDGQWNNALYEQIVARAIRFKSHMNLPESERYVDVMKLFLCYKNEASILEKLNEGKSFNFERFLAKVNETREKMKDKKSKNKKEEEEEEDDEDLDFDPEQLEKLKKGSVERKKYLEKNKQFAKNKEKYETSSLISGIPSTDFYMFVLEKVKQNIIDKFIKKVDEIPSLEQSIFDIPKHKEVLQKVLDDKLDGGELMKYLISIYRPAVGKFEQIFNQIEMKKKTQLETFLEKRNELAKLQKERLKINVGQEYFTPISEVKKLIELSGIKKIYDKDLSQTILEPTAGFGNIVNELLNLVKINKIPLTIDMVEIDDSNRKELQKFEVLGDLCSLMKTKDFLDFVPNKRYDWVFMNPPFHLDKKFNKKYEKDYYDIDFVKRAYYMLDNGGVLIAITGQGWKKRKDQEDWLKSVDAEIVDNNNVKWEGSKGGKASEINKLKISYIYIKRVIKDLALAEKEERKYLKPENALFIEN